MLQKFSQAKVGSFIRLLRLPSPRQEHKWSIHLLSPANVNSSTDTLLHCWENTWHSFYDVWKRIKISSWKIHVFWAVYYCSLKHRTSLFGLLMQNKDIWLREPFREYQKCTQLIFSTQIHRQEPRPGFGSWFGFLLTGV